MWEHKLEDPKWKSEEGVVGRFPTRSCVLFRDTIVGKRKTYHDTVDRMRPLVTLLEHDEKLAQGRVNCRVVGGMSLRCAGEERRVPEAVVDVLKGVFKEIVKRE